MARTSLKMCFESCTAHCLSTASLFFVVRRPLSGTSFTRVGAKSGGCGAFAPVTSQWLSPSVPARRPASV